ncbi:hypothetical protein [Acetobacterium bakii]|uniref:Uncharacterized protein n=1 Tax=Acetobacterium bakii TaxID=52689 RepID=A0A0L6TZU8_9FIRM|nr:hypothetical protein [Acetobacterium bakii]KNZ41768.1 hypothetical protein AKG39_09020 [Acetobacterium bakii]
MKVSILEIILKGIPENLIFTLGLFAFTKTRIKSKPYWIAAIMIFVAVYILRLMPINYSVNIMINVIFCTVLGINVLKISLLQSVKANLLTFSAILVGEATNYFLLQSICGSQKMLEIMGDPMTKVIYTIPSTIVFGAIIFTAYYFNVIKVSKKKEILNLKKER